MKLNCEPGDLAVVFGLTRHFAHFNDRIVEVLERAPNSPFVNLPNGAVSKGGVDSWIVYFPTMVEMPLSAVEKEWTHYAVCPDRHLRPIGRPRESNEAPRAANLPKIEEVATC